MHFTVIVTGEDPEDQMAPFCESLESVMRGEAEEFAKRKVLDPNASSDPVYLQRVDVIEDRRMEWDSDLANGKNHEPSFEVYVHEYYYGEIKFLPKALYLSKPEINVWEYKPSTWHGGKPVKLPSEWRWSLEWGNRFAVIGEDGKLEQVITYAIAQPKWDWFEIGGRWKNFFKVKEGSTARVAYENAARPNMAETIEKSLINAFGGFKTDNPRDKRVNHADQVRKGDIDIEGMQADARQEAHTAYDKFQALTGGQPFRTFDEILANCGGNFEEAKKVQEADPVDSMVRHSDFIWYDQDELKQFRQTREEFAEHWANRVLSPYSLLHNGVWEDKETWVSGEGHFAGHYLKREPGEWDKYVMGVFNSLSDDTLLTLIDYHC